IGGMETYSLRLAEELSKRCELEWVVLPGRRDGRAPSAVSLAAFGMRCALRMPFRTRIDVAHIGDLSLWPIGLLELLFRRARHLALAAHGSDVSLASRGGLISNFYRAYLKLGTWLLPNARIIANSAYIADLAKSAGFKDVRIVPLGTDMCASGRMERS